MEQSVRASAGSRLFFGTCGGNQRAYFPAQRSLGEEAPNSRHQGRSHFLSFAYEQQTVAAAQVFIEHHAYSEVGKFDLMKLHGAGRDVEIGKQAHDSAIVFRGIFEQPIYGFVVTDTLAE